MIHLLGSIGGKDGRDLKDQPSGKLSYEGEERCPKRMVKNEDGVDAAHMIEN